MKLLYICDNGLCEKDKQYYWLAPDYVNTLHLKPYFNDISFFSRKGQYNDACKLVPLQHPVYLFKKYSFLKLYLTLSREISDADVLICYGVNGYLGQWMGLIKKKRVIAYMGGDSSECLKCQTGIKKWFIAPVIKYLDKWKCRTASYVHYCAPYLFKRYPTENMHLFCSAVNIKVCEEVFLLRKKKILSDNLKYTLGMIGYPTNVKGIDIAIKALALLKNQYPISLEVVGYGDFDKYKPLIRELDLQDSVLFLGSKQAGPEVFHWLDHIDVYIQPSRTEGLPRAVIEAMSRGCPVVASMVGALPHLIDKEFLFESENIKELSQKLEVLFADKKMMLMQAEKNFCASKEFSVDKRDEKYKKFYGEIVSEIVEGRNES